MTDKLTQEELRVEELRKAVNASCTCGGREPRCAACVVWRRALRPEQPGSATPKLTREELCRYNDPDGEPCRLPAVAKYREKNVCVWHRSIFIDGKTAPPPEQERPEWWEKRLELSFGQIAPGVVATKEVVAALVASHNARLEAEARVKELEAELEAASLRGTATWRRYLRQHHKRLAAEAELRRLRDALKCLDWSSRPWAFAETETAVFRCLAESESRYPIPDEDEHRGSRR